MTTNEHQQTGRTTRMLEEANNYAIATMAQAVYVVFPTNTHADGIRQHRRPPGGWAQNLRFIGASSSMVTDMDFEGKRITLGFEGTFSAFFDPDTIEKHIAHLQGFANEYNAGPGQFGYKEPEVNDKRKFLQQIIDAYDTVPLRGRPADAPMADKVEHIIKILKGSESQ